MATLRPRDCAQCGAALTPTGRFCPECGAPVVEPAVESRRTVTLLFTDVTGSTALGEQIDPEAYRSVMGRYFAVAHDTIGYHGGTVEKFVGDAVLAVFGVPEVREDDALRAVRAAADLQVAIRALSEELEHSLGVQLVVRIGVNTGQVVTGAARAGGAFATGDAVNTAARLEQAAGPGEILLGADTLRLVRDAVTVEEIAAITAKGKAQAVAAYRLVAVGDLTWGRSRHLDAPLVGRDRENRVLDDGWARTIERSRGHLVTVLGSAGLGKSRLVSEFARRVAGQADVLSGRCVSYGEGITYFPVIQVIRQALSLTGDESQAVVERGLSDVLGDGSGAADTVRFLLPLLGRYGESGSTDETAWAVRRLLELLAARRPVVVTIEDLHWAEPTLLELLQRLHAELADLPLMLVCTARPEFLDAHPEWGSGAINSLTLGLDPLGPADVAKALASHLDGEVPDTVVEAVAEWSGGNPLFVEEMASHLVEIGLLARHGTNWQLTRRLASTDSPPGVSALLAARLQRLPADERHLLERVAVVGLAFTTEDAIAVAPDVGEQAPGLLGSLVQRDQLRRVREAGQESWAFKHILIRDAAYDALPKARRADLHQRFAALIEARSGTHEGPGPERSAFIAHHFERAARYRVELAPHDPATHELVTRAVESLMAAAADAESRDDPGATLTLLRSARALAPPFSPLRREICVSLVRTEVSRGNIEAASRFLAVLEEDLDDTATPLERAFVRSARLEHRLFLAEPVDPQDVVAAAAETERLARRAGRPRELVAALRAELAAYNMMGRWAEQDRVLREIEKVGDPLERRFAERWRGAVIAFGPEPLDRLAEHYRRITNAAATAEDVGLLLAAEALALAAADSPDARNAIETAAHHWESAGPAATARGRPMLGRAWATIGDLSEAIEWNDRTIERWHGQGENAMVSTLVLNNALLRLERGDDPNEIAPLIERSRVDTSPFDNMSIAQRLAVQALLVLGSGDVEHAEDLAAHALDRIDATDQVHDQAELRRWLSRIPRAAGNLERERRWLTLAVQRYRAKRIVAPARWCQQRLEELAAQP